MKVVIVGKTRKGSGACVGAMAAESSQSLRLLLPHDRPVPLSTGWEVGTIWDIDCEVVDGLTPPHTEDVIVHRQRFIGYQENLTAFILERVSPWRGSPECLFNGLVRFTRGGRGYIAERIGIPSMSTGFWIPDRPLRARIDGANVYFVYGAGGPVKEIKYVGLVQPPEVIHAGSVVRVSLAGWWNPEDAPTLEQRCYLQLSGLIGEPYATSIGSLINKKH